MALFGRSDEELVELLTKAIDRSIIKLSEDKRYLLIINATNEDEIKEFIMTAKQVLDLENSNLKIMFVANPNIKLLEF